MLTKNFSLELTAVWVELRKDSGRNIKTFALAIAEEKF